VDELLSAGFEVIATDIAPQMIADGRRRFDQRRNVRFEVAPADEIPVGDATLDAVTIMGVLEYLNDEEAVYREARRALKPNGVLIVTYPHYWSPTRAWYRLAKPLAAPVLAVLRALLGRAQPPGGLKHREYRLRQTIAEVEAQGFEVNDVVFYNFKLGFRPLEDWFPRATARQSERLERFCRTQGLRGIGTGFILRARRK
jgi:ubiquinone/menaquinone biosynthesis C-methylase UbiE